MAEEIVAYLRLIAVLATPVTVTGALSLCRDPDDDAVLETALAGGATHVVSRDEDITRDTDLFRLLEQNQVRPATLNRFLIELMP
jgi:predicted nucleic acid-binding protein